jgi:acetyltransferase
MKTCKKPIYPILPSVVNVKDEIADFIAKGNVAFDDEVLFGSALGKVYQASVPQPTKTIETIDLERVQQLISTQSDGYLSPKATYELLHLAGIPMVEQHTVTTNEELHKLTTTLTYPVVIKVVGPIHKSDVGGVVLNIKDETEATETFTRLMQIDGATSVLIQPMQQGLELFIGAKREPGYPPIVVCGLGGIFVEVLKDVSNAMAPISEQESLQMIQHLKAYPMLQGIRGKKGIDINSYASSIRKIGLLMQAAPEIMELDLNPLLASENKIVAVDARIRIEK